MPTDQASTKEATAIYDSHDISVQIHDEQSEASSLQHGKSSESITDTKPDTERLPTHQEVDTSEEGINTAENGDNGNIVPPLNLAPPVNLNSPPAESEATSLTQESKPQPDGNADVKKEENSTQPLAGRSDQPEDTNTDHGIVEKDATTVQSDVTSATTNGDEKDVGKEEANSVKQAGQSTRAQPATGAKPRISSAGGNGPVTARPQQKDTNQPTTGSKIRTPRGIIGALQKQNKQNNSKDSEQKSTKRPPSAASKSQRTTESKLSSLTERNKKPIEKTIVKKKSQANLSTSLSKPGPVESKPTDKLDKKQTTNQIQNTGTQDIEKNQQTETSPSTEPPTKPPTQIKPANGVVHGGNGGGKEKASKENENSEKDIKEKQRKAHVLLSRAVMKRVASLPNQTSSQPNVDLNSSAGSKSLDGKFSSAVPSHPRPTDKTQSMQSLAVPAPAIGPVPLEAEERASIGSGRDSVRLSVDSTSRKSVDYRLNAAHAVVPVGGGDDRPKSVMMHDDSMIRTAIPILSVRLAVVCLVLNIVLPGVGTMVSGFSVLCGAKSRLSNKGDTKAATVCVNLFVGASQLATVTFLLVGWFWSLAWGIKMVILAVEHRTELRQQREKELQTLALRAFGSPANLRRSLLPPV